MAGIFGLVASAHRARIAAVPSMTDLRDKIQANDRPACALYANLLLDAQAIDQGEHDAILAVLAATEPDPSYAPLVSWAILHLGRPVDAGDVAAARPA